jgi:bacteriocin-like protein
MNTTEKAEIRELTASELEQVTGGMACATGAHFKMATLDTSSQTSVWSWGTDEDSMR